MGTVCHAETRPHKVIVLAGGFGTRLAEHTDEMPKPMVEIGGRPILWHILKIYSYYGFNDFLIACGHKGWLVKRYFLEYRERMCDLRIDYVQDRIERLHQTVEPWRIALIDAGDGTMTGGRVKRLKSYLDDGTFLLTYGDGLGDIDIPRLLAFHQSHGRLATFTVVRRPSQFGCPILEGDRVVSFVEKPNEPDGWINGGFLVLEPGVVDYIDSDSTSLEFDTLPRLAENNELMAYRHEGFWHAMDTLRDVRRLNKMWASDQARWKLWDR